MGEYQNSDNEGKIDAVWLDRRPGNSAKSWEEDTSDNLAYKPNDGRYGTRTTLKAAGSNDYQKYSWFARANDGQYDKWRQRENYVVDALNFVEVAANRLDLPTYQVQWVKEIVLDIIPENGSNQSPLGSGAHKIEATILAIITLVVDAESNPNPETWSPYDRIIYDESFEELMDNVGTDRSSIRSLRAMIRDRTDFF